MADLLTAAELPDGFAYPPQFLRVVEQRARLGSFSECLHRAIDDLIEFE